MVQFTSSEGWVMMLPTWVWIWDRTPHGGLSPLVNLWCLIFVISTLNFACKSLLPSSLNWEKMTAIGYSHFSLQEYLKVRQRFIPAVFWLQAGSYPIELTGWLLVAGGYITHKWLLVGCDKTSPWSKVKDALLRKNKVPQSLGHAGLNFDLNLWSLS